ncbi:MAG: cell wall hydrolase [Pseudomonadota bacterium]
MSRQTYSLSAVAIVAAASLSFASADSAEALAQDGIDGGATEQSAETAADEAVEIVPVASDTANGESSQSDVTFVSIPVVQSLENDAVNETPTSLRELVKQVEVGEMSDQMQCLAGAVYFESRGEALAGQLAVAQVVINRSEDARWPASYCGVVYQRAQFSFVKNGNMPRIRTSSGAWQRAKAIAQIAHAGLWESEAGDAVYFHATYVRPKWSRRKERTAKIDTHIFYR